MEISFEYDSFYFTKIHMSSMPFLALIQFILFAISWLFLYVRYKYLLCQHTFQNFMYLRNLPFVVGPREPTVRRFKKFTIQPTHFEYYVDFKIQTNDTLV